MLAKTAERLRAIDLRKQGYSYAEILRQVPVSQASLSQWLKDIPLSAQLQAHLQSKKTLGQAKGALKRHQMRIDQETVVLANAAAQIPQVSHQELWLMGIIAYWCEGTKQKEHNVSQVVSFANSDIFLIKLFLFWLKGVCHIPDEHILYRLHIHMSADANEALQYWSKELNIPLERFSKTIYKKHNPKTVRYNTGVHYHGLLRVTVKQSTILNRIIKGWVLGISNNIDNL